MRRSIVAAISAVGVLGAMGLGASGSSAAPTAPAAPSQPVVADANSEGFMPAPVSWGKCSEPGFSDAGLECGFVTVPLDYAKPSGTKIKLAVDRLAHTVSSSKYQGVMLVNPGGPGASGLTLPVLQGFVPNGAGNAYDWIGWSPRGVAGSSPALSCDSKYPYSYNRPPYDPSTGSESAWLAKAKAYAAACDKKGGALLDHVRTLDTVKDMEMIRKALGRTQINFYGFSYGSYLGQIYATRYPTHMRRMVLDGVVDPRRVWYRANLDQDVAFEKTIRIYFDWVAKYDSVYHLGTTGEEVAGHYYDTLAALTKKPAGGKIGPDEWNDVFLSAGYYVYGWEDVATAFAAAVNENRFAPIQDLFGADTSAGADNGYAMYLGTQCSDSAWPKSLTQYRSDNAKVAAQAPFITWNNAVFNLPCRFWPAKSGKLSPSGVNGVKTLLISETLDPATPYSGAIEVRKRFGSSVLIEGVGGTTHAGSLSGVTCTDDTIASFLSTGHLPKRQAGDESDVKCPPVPQPDPTADAAGAQKVGGITRAALQQVIGAH
jgi:pimeloyl-ACP methyl ester carboxylesterase